MVEIHAADIVLAALKMMSLCC